MKRACAKRYARSYKTKTSAEFATKYMQGNGASVGAIFQCATCGNWHIKKGVARAKA